MREVFPITPIRPRSNTREGVLAGISGMTVAEMVGAVSGGSEASKQDDSYLSSQEARVVGIDLMANLCA